MHKVVKSCIMVFVLAGLVLTPACASIESTQGNSPNTTAPTRSSTPNHSIESSETPLPSQNTGESVSAETPKSSEDTNNDDKDIKIITNDKELEEYFNSITDEEIEELFNIIENIDISPDIGVDIDPGFEDITIP